MRFFFDVRAGLALGSLDQVIESTLRFATIFSDAVVEDGAISEAEIAGVLEMVIGAENGVKFSARQKKSWVESGSGSLPSE